MKKIKRDVAYFWSFILIVGLMAGFAIGQSNNVDVTKSFHELQQISKSSSDLTSVDVTDGGTGGADGKIDYSNYADKFTGGYGSSSFMLKTDYDNSGTSGEVDIAEKARALVDGSDSYTYEDLVNGKGTCILVFEYVSGSKYKDNGVEKDYYNSKANVTVPDQCINSECRIVVVDGSSYHDHVDYNQVAIGTESANFWDDSLGTKYWNGDSSHTKIASIPGSGKQLRDDTGIEEDKDMWGTNDKASSGTKIYVCG